MKRMNFPGRRDKRREEAQKRQEVFDRLTTEQKYNTLKERGHRHCEEAVNYFLNSKANPI